MRFDIRTWLGSRGKSRRGKRFLLGKLESSYSQQRSPRAICIQSGDGGSGIRGKRDRPVSFPAFLPSFLPSSSSPSGAERRVSPGRGAPHGGSLPSGSLFRCRMRQRMRPSTRTRPSVDENRRLDARASRRILWRTESRRQRRAKGAARSRTQQVLLRPTGEPCQRFTASGVSRWYPAEGKVRCQERNLPLSTSPGASRRLSVYCSDRTDKRE